ncbi:hypothetical protein THASP1DRAFT_27405 [Thamnocephalis sphaerospora]|uniref:UBP-type domain-containing protein n=1 Tax=Thamnocephalis sphaerospora TaxID=78915 RepID=A0A4P9XZB1_9FUNG|nr:hypothetical protein THASP1DRAFT_27405 [Thamnocephalis sphaerospora]|eukprot:RKP10810.1 hypothetical protein THASP1DRAFT_27405 [Thamnocephalis sphaerospora]
MADATAQLLAGFAVAPRLDCPHVLALGERLNADLSTLDVTAPCEVCGDKSENWYCLSCGRIMCSRYVQGHMAAHATSGKGAEDEHAVCASFSDLSFWCFRCEDYIEHPLLETCRCALHQLKFGAAPGTEHVSLENNAPPPKGSSSK